MNTKLLKTMGQISNGIVLKKDKPITTISAAMNILAISKTNSDIDFAIYDIPSFLSFASLTSEDRAITVKNNIMTIKDGKTSMKYVGAPEDSIIVPPEDTSSLTGAEYTNEFSIAESQFKQLMSACSVLNAKSIVMSFDGSTVTVTTESDYDDANTFQTEFDTTPGGEFVIKLDRQSMKLIDDSYIVSVGAKAVKFEGSDLTYYVVRAA